MEISTFTDFEEQEIQELYRETFSDSEGSAEGAVIGQLVLEIMNKTAAQDILGFVASEDEQLVGCIFFTRLFFDAPITAFLLSPVAVRTDRQGQKIGQKLIQFGLDQLRKIETELAFTYGDPNYYSQVGFEPIIEGIDKAPFVLSQPEGWLGQSLGDGSVHDLPGRARCVEAFNKPELW